MKIRLHGDADDITTAAERLSQVFTVLNTSRAYPDRAPSNYYRVYLDVEL